MVENSIYEVDDADDELKRLASGEAVTIPVGAVLSSKSGKVETNGAKIKASKGGKKDGGGFKKTTKGLFERNLEGRTEAQQRNVDQLRRHLVSLGDKSVVAVRVQTTDAVYGFSEAVLRREVFGIRGDTGQDDTLNLSSGYEQCSYGALTFTPLASETGNDGGGEVSIVDGVVTISVDVAANGNSDGTVRNAVTNKIKAVFGSDMEAVADYWMCECALLVHSFVEVFLLSSKFSYLLSLSSLLIFPLFFTRLLTSRDKWIMDCLCIHQFLHQCLQ